MHGSQDYLVGLAQLHELTEADERRSLWRQGLATLAAATTDQKPTPLEGLSPEALLSSVRVALSHGLVDDVAFLSKPVAAAALFEIASALPPSAEKRDLGRRVLKSLNEGDAATFVTLATSLALASQRALAGPSVRARVALALRLPIGSGISVDGLALALISRPDLEREWFSAPSTGSLPSRRLAARLVECAARAAGRRAIEGDDSGLRVLERPSVATAWARLITDRESLVWRHLATARGLLAQEMPLFAEQIERDLNPKAGIGEWRRAATSLAATIARDPVGGLARCRDTLKGDLMHRDPGIAGAMIFGLVRAGEEEPEACETLLAELVAQGGIDAIEALVDLREEHSGREFGAKAAVAALEKLLAAPGVNDDGALALSAALAEDLASDADKSELTLRSCLAAALTGFAEGRPIDGLTENAIACAQDLITKLEKTNEDSPDGRRTGFRALRELDLGVLETSTLSDLCAMVERDATTPAARALPELMDRLTAWLLSREQSPLATGQVAHPTLRLRRLRSLLHLLDCENASDEKDPGGQARDRRLRTFRVLLNRVHGDPPSPLRRTLCAALARACDALVRDEICELSDVLVAVSSHARTADELQVLAEASMAPEVKDIFRAAAEVGRTMSLKSGTVAPGDRSFLESFRALGESLPPGTSARVEGLRRAVLGIARSLDVLNEAPSLADLRNAESAAAFDRLEDAVHYGAQLVAGVKRRLGLPASGTVSVAGQALRELDTAIDHTLRELDDELGDAVTRAMAALHNELPAGIADVVSRVLARFANLPREARIQVDGASVAATDRRLRLPAWLPPSRVLGGFYVLRPIGVGAGGSVFVARRVEERHDPHAELYAMKVPSYKGTAAHTLSEEEFLIMFREEAGALMTLPQQLNLAGFVTFDARARPKPILVMELVLGPTLERIIDKRDLSVAVSLSILDGVAAGLGAMHAGGIGHLDVKPANIILRLPDMGTASRAFRLDDLVPSPVLVDFGLSGRKLRPGCASPFYGAPEIWETDSHARTSDPMAADVYAFCSLAFEMLTGKTLFAGDTLPALVACHLGHDGNPPGLQILRKDSRTNTAADVLSAGLQPDPKTRASLNDVRAALASLRSELEVLSWPLGV